MGATVAGSSTVRNLGVMFDQHMTFVSHTDEVVRRCTGALCGLSHCKHSLPGETLVTLVQCLVLSLLRYCLPVYGASNRTQMARLQKVMNFAARVISGRRKFSHISDVLRELNWLSAHNLFLYHSLTLLRRILVTSEPESLSDGLITRYDIHHRTTRHSDLLATPSIRTEYGRRRFRHSAATAFNSLPPCLRALDCIHFKAEVKKHLLHVQNEQPG